MRSFVVPLKPDSRQTRKAAARDGHTNMSALIETPCRGCLAVVPPANQKGTDKANSSTTNRCGDRVSAVIQQGSKLPRQSDFPAVRLTSGALRGLASSRPEPHVLLAQTSREVSHGGSLAGRRSSSRR